MLSYKTFFYENLHQIAQNIKLYQYLRIHILYIIIQTTKQYRKPVTLPIIQTAGLQPQLTNNLDPERWRFGSQMPHFAEPVFQQNLQSAFFQNSVAMTPSPLLKNLNDLSKKKEIKIFTGGSRASLQFNSSVRLPSRVMAALSFPAIGWHRWSPS